MKRLILILLTVACMLPAQGQETDSLAGTYINQGEWFALRDCYETDSNRMSPFIRLFAQTMLHQTFNRPYEANRCILKLLREHQQTMGFGNIYAMLGMLAENYAKSGETNKAAETLSNFINQIEGKVEDKITEDIRERERIYRQLSAYRLYLRNDQAHYRVPFRFNEVGDSGQVLMQMPGRLNGKTGLFCFDTGASYNVATPEAAKRYRMRIIGSGMKSEGTRKMEGQLAIADSLRIGNLTLHHVPFTILDLQQGNERAAHVLGSLSLIIGQPLLTQFARYTIDFDHHVIDFYTHSPRNHRKSNLCIRGSLKIAVTKDGRTFGMTLDSGATTSLLGTAYYQQYSAEVAKEGQWDIIGGSGFGGVVYESVFKMPRVALSVSDTPFTMYQLPVVALSAHPNTLSDGFGRLGLDFFRLWKRMTIDHTNMTIDLQ